MKKRYKKTGAKTVSEGGINEENQDRTSFDECQPMPGRHA
jgi:hypothetical protein